MAIEVTEHRQLMEFPKSTCYPSFVRGKERQIGFTYTGNILRVYDIGTNRTLKGAAFKHAIRELPSYVHEAWGIEI